MITHRFGLDEIADAFRSAYDNRREVIKAIVVN